MQWMLLCVCRFQAPTATSTSSSTTNTTSSTTGNPASSGGGAAIPPNMFRSMFSQMQAENAGGQGGGGAGDVSAQVVGNQLQQAEVLYQSQLEQMQNMGFPNRQANLNGEL